MEYNKFIEELNKIGIEITDEKMHKLSMYFDILVEENEKYNLTALTSKEDVFYKHFYDSIAIAQYLELDNQSICDVGSGAGFPSIPLKIVFEDLNITIVDALSKRIKFLTMLCEKLQLDNVSCVHARAEDYAKDYRESFDFVTARAVAALPVLCELCIPLVKEQGYFFVLKGSNGLEELNVAKNAISKLGCEMEKCIEYTLPLDYGNRTFFTFKKVKQTPSKYPRNFGQIKNKPL